MAQALSKAPATARILLTGDVMLGERRRVLQRRFGVAGNKAGTLHSLAEAANGPLPPTRGFEYPWGVALADMQAKQPDARVINLETAVTTSPHAWPAKGINYRMHPGNVPTLGAAGIDVCCLANNHSLDWGVEGLLETLDVLRGAGMQTAGAGRTLAEAQAPAGVQLPPGSGTSGGARLLVWALGHASSGVPAGWAAGDDRPGILTTDLLPAGVHRLAELVRQHKRPADLALVSVHWGANWGYQVPEEQRRFAHSLIDEAGVDVVHGHSSHHLKGAELHRGHLITYGCGDLLSDYEGISNSSIEAVYPPEQYRDDLGALWYADVNTHDGRLHQLILTPTRLKQLSLHPPDRSDMQHFTAVLDRECGRLRGLGKAYVLPGEGSLVLTAAQAGGEA
ncbi:putative polyglutamine synthesis accessory protein [Chlorella vulgaris]